MDGCPEERLDLVMRYMTECERLAAEAMQGAQDAQMAQAAAQVPPEMGMAGAPGAPAIGGDINISPEMVMEQPPIIPGR